LPSGKRCFRISKGDLVGGGAAGCAAIPLIDTVPTKTAGEGETVTFAENAAAESQLEQDDLGLNRWGIPIGVKI